MSRFYVSASLDQKRRMRTMRASSKKNRGNLFLFTQEQNEVIFVVRKIEKEKETNNYGN